MNEKRSIEEIKELAKRILETSPDELKRISIDELIAFLQDEDTEQSDNENHNKKIESFKLNRPKTMTIFNDKVTNNLINFNNGVYHPVTKITPKEDIGVLLQSPNVKTSKVLTAFDIAVLEAIYTLLKTNNYVDAEMIKQLWTQNNRNTKTNLLQEINKSIDKMIVIRITLDITNELNSYFKNSMGNDILEALSNETYLLPLNKTTIKRGGIKKVVYYPLITPSYYSYTDAQAQYITGNAELLKLPTVTQDNVIINRYILKRVKDMQRQKQKNKNNSYIENILYDNLFKECGLLQDIDKGSNKYRIYKNRYKKTIYEILNHCRDLNELKNYEDLKSGRTLTGIKIIL